MFKIFKYTKPKEWILLFVCLILVCGQVYCNVAIPDCTLEISNMLISISSIVWKDMLIACLKMLGFAFGTIACSICVNLIVTYVITSLLARVRGKIFEKVNAFSFQEINHFSIPSLITRSTNDITQIQQVLTTFLTMGLTAPLTAIYAVINIVSISKQYNVGSLSLINVFSVIAILLVVSVIIFTVIPKFKKIQKATDNLNLVTRESLTGVKVIRANGSEEKQLEKLENTNREYTKLDKFVSLVMGAIDPALSFIMQGTSLAIVWGIGLLAGENPSAISLMSTFTQLSMFIIMGFTSLSIIFTMLPRGIVSGKRIQEVLNTPLSLKDGSVTKSANAGNIGSIRFEDVSFRYPNSKADVLEHISFEAKAGETVAFIGSTGSGKSTLINLIPRFYDCTEGKIFINGLEIKEFSQGALHEIIGYVPQKGLLFSGTIEDNLRFGKENANDEEIAKAIEVSGSKFVYNFPDGLKHQISQGGKNVSGGQRQRLSIARAIIKRPDILIFDDSFSALDYKTDKVVRKRINKEYKNTTKLIVAQRIGTIMNADKIIVLDEGKVVGMGTHQELLKKCKVYKQIALSQLSQEELDNE